MKRKILIIMFCLISAICLVCSFAACDKIASIGGGGDQAQGGGDQDDDNQNDDNQGGENDSGEEVKILSAVLSRCGMKPQLLWALEDVESEKYDTFETEWQITYENGETKRESLTADQLAIDGLLSCGHHEIVAEYEEGVTDTLSVYVNGYGDLEAAGEVSLNKQTDAIGLVELGMQSVFIDGTAELVGYFFVPDGEEYTRYFGIEKLSLSRLSGLDYNTAGKQRCNVVIEKNDARSGEEEPLGEIDVLVYDLRNNGDEVFLNKITACTQDGEELLTISVTSDNLFIDRESYMQQGSSADDSRYTEGYFDYEFVLADFVVFRGGDDEYKKIVQLRALPEGSCEVTKAVDRDITSCGKRTIQLSVFEEPKEFSYEVYAGSNPVRSASVSGLDGFEIVLQDGMTGEAVKDALVGKVLNFTDYNAPSKQESVTLTAEQIKGYHSLDTESFAVQYVYLQPESSNISIPVKVVREYTTAGATLVDTLRSKYASGVNFTFTKTALNDLAQTEADDVTEIELYDNNCVLIKNTKNGLGNVLMEYQLDGNQLHFSRHGLNCGVVRVDLSEKTFRIFRYEEELDGTLPSETRYLYHHRYHPDYNFGYSFWIFLYHDGKGTCNVHRTGYAAGPDKNGNSYQIAGVDIVAGFEIRTVNGEKHAFINMCDREIEFVCGEELEDNIFYRLTPVGDLL